MDRDTDSIRSILCSIPSLSDRLKTRKTLLAPLRLRYRVAQVRAVTATGKVASYLARTASRQGNVRVNSTARCDYYNRQQT